MPRLARIVIPHVAHHVIQRGNCLMPAFFSDEDRQLHLELLANAARASGTWCLARYTLENHVHLILSTEPADGLCAMPGEAHRRYSRHVNLREGWRDHLFQSRFASYPMDDAHLMAAERYAELNPVAARLVTAVPDWHCSSAHSHIAGRRATDNPLTDVAALGAHVPNWRAMLRYGLEAGGTREHGEALDERIEARLHTGRALASDEWIAKQVAALQRTIAPRRPGRQKGSRVHSNAE